MNHNYSLKFTLFDGILGAISLLIIIVCVVATNLAYSQNSGKERIAEVYLDGILLENKSVSFNSLDEEVEIILKKDDYPNLLGDVKILVNKDKGICVHDVTCPNKLCKNQGWINRVGYNIVCIPNGFFVVIKAKSVDFDIPLG